MICEAKDRALYLALAAAFALMLGAKLAVISRYASQLPFWDQWDAEAANLLVPYLRHSLAWTDFAAAHNEHRIVPSRLLALGLFELAGEWQPLLEMTVNALLHVLSILVLCFLISPSLGKVQAVVTIIGTAITFALPLGWENTIAGFQSQFYFLLLLSFTALALEARTEAFSPQWLGGLLLAAGASLSLASGSLTFVAAFVITILQLAVGSRKCSFREAAGAVVQFVLGGVSLWLVPTVAGHATMKAQSIADFINAIIAVTSFPLSGVLGAMVVHVPLAIWSIRFLTSRSKVESHGWVLLALAVWLCGQFASVAYGRGEGAMASRYFDILLLSIPLNFAALMHLSKGLVPQVWKRALVAFVWVLIVGAGLSTSLTYNGLPGLVARAEQQRVQEVNVEGYLTTGNEGFLIGKPLLSIPYPDPARLIYLLSVPEVREILPEKLFRRTAERSAILAQTFAKGHLAGLTNWFWRSALDSNLWLLALGSILAVVSIVSSSVGVSIQTVARGGKNRVREK